MSNLFLIKKLILLSFFFTFSSYAAIENVKLPKGFKLSLYADVSGARSLALAPDGTLFVGNRGGDKVYAVLDTNKDYKADKVITLAKGLRMPNGVAFRNGNLYVAEVSRIIVFENILSNLKENATFKDLGVKFPEDGHHGWKYIAFSPEGKLIVPVGAPCNICESSEKYAGIYEVDLKTKKVTTLARGVRNTVGFDWHPETGSLWFTDNGRDMLGDDIPPEEINVLKKTGQHFGYPYCHAGTIKDPKFGDDTSCSKYSGPIHKLPAHVAPLGIQFYTGKMFPESFKNGAFIAEHGSWNRSTPDGYRITFVSTNGDKTKKSFEFLGGLLEGRRKKARPVDFEVLPDGSLLFSDDYKGKVYRITYKDPSQ
ncbi:MAG: sorbosone dehydrogenase family protein [Bacteriovoracaceae bacterium]|nr:sorbosone dehydrogenase family protein [Bacteriovoracaceae bacterium]